jgi:hypothetical protein
MKNITPKDPAIHPQKRILQYQHIDGSFELTFGGAVLLMGYCFYVISQITLPDSFAANNLLPFTPLIAFVGGAFLIDYLVQRLRSRVTYPRSGYIAYKKPQPLKRSTRLFIWIGIPILAVILEALLFLNRSKFPAQNPDNFSFVMLGFSGLLFSGLWAIIGWKVALPRFYLIAAVSLLTSAGLFFNGIGGYLGWALFLAVMGAALLISGGVTLWQYLQNNPLLAETKPNEH